MGEGRQLSRANFQAKEEKECAWRIVRPRTSNRMVVVKGPQYQPCLDGFSRTDTRQWCKVSLLYYSPSEWFVCAKNIRLKASKSGNLFVRVKNIRLKSSKSGNLPNENEKNFFFFFFYILHFYNCIVKMGFLPLEIRVAFPVESQLRQSRATQPMAHAGCLVFPQSTELWHGLRDL